jgi:hypothetical protein
MCIGKHCKVVKFVHLPFDVTQDSSSQLTASCRFVPLKDRLQGNLFPYISRSARYHCHKQLAVKSFSDAKYSHS